MEIRMDAYSTAAALGLLGLVSGVALVNFVSTPRAALVGAIIAGIAVFILSGVAITVLAGLPST
jgi:hypothetical protein